MVGRKKPKGRDRVQHFQGTSVAIAVEHSFHLVEFVCAEP